MKKGSLWIILISALILTAGIGVTLAYLVASSGFLENSFTVGTVEISLTETTGTEYKLTPGISLQKDPTVTVKGGSEGCWLFVRIEKSPGFDQYCSFAVENGWTGLSGYAGVYYRKIEFSHSDQTVPVLKDNQVLVRDTVTEKQLNELSEQPTLSFTAYAIQSSSVTSPQEAWRTLNP